ncbi:hypothetical protein [Caballeronia sp. LZ034LL]|uniref:hypothetical protein n=1 Tax=Caballeronia sp. LZ034LL TaxID=3038567 RepID=UPI00285CA77F|nr:hypothetical protein [Caballeronia sp. LZ034LL]MDR5838940.1 hypothetical protein [Caballeronia sp. LZ034LL]
MICLVSSQKEINETVSQQRERLIPQDLFKGKSGPDFPIHFKISIFDPSTPSLSFDKYLLSHIKGMDAVILLVEKKHAHHVQHVSRAIFAAVFDTADKRLRNFKNFFGSYFSPLFRNFFALRAMMHDAEKEQALMLPLRNFEAAELVQIIQLVNEESRSTAFAGELEMLLTRLIKRRRKRARSVYQTKYFVDDKQMHFVYGNERHALFDTAAPHNAACHVNGLFRFGRQIDKSRHFNVSFGDGDETIIAGDFPDCHGGVKTIPATPRRSHANMFANDFC